MLQARQSGGDSVTLLTQQLRRYSAEYVKITKTDTDQAKQMVDKFIKNEILQYICSNSALPISKLEYAGSLYERLKTESADEVDVMVVLQLGKKEVVQCDAGIPGFVLLKATQTSLLQKYTDAHGYIIPEKLRAKWFRGLVDKAVNHIKEKYSTSAPELCVHDHGPAVQVDMTDVSCGKKLSADLVPTFQLSPTDYFVAKRYTGKSSPSCDHSLLWRQSFSLKEKARLQDMDKEDQGCRHELLRIVKTIMRAETTFAKVTSYHLKTVFLRYNSDSRLQWGPDMLGERFTEYMEMLYEALAQNRLSHFWLEEVNLFDDIQSKTLENMANRMRRILDNDKERRKVLKCEDTEPFVSSSNENKTLESCSVTSPPHEQCLSSTSLLQLLRQFLDHLGPLLSEETKWCKDAIDKYVKEGILKFCSNHSTSTVISKFEYGGSFYENLKTIGLDENDVLIYVVLKAKKSFVSIDVNKAGSAVAKITEGSPYKEYSNSEGILLPKKFKSWLVKMVTAAVQEIRKQVASESLSFKVSSISTGAKVVIKVAKKSLGVQLIPAFQMDSDEFFSPPSQEGFLASNISNEGADHDKAWVKSYTFALKALLKDMDKDNGCRHNLFKVVNTVLKREPTFFHLSSLHVKMAFLWYSSETKDFSNDKLAERFMEFMEFLQNKLQAKVLQHFWMKDVNLLSEISASTLENMHRRLTRLLSSEQERNKVLSLETLTSLQ